MGLLSSSSTTVLGLLRNPNITMSTDGTLVARHMSMIGIIAFMFSNVMAKWISFAAAGFYYCFIFYIYSCRCYQHCCLWPQGTDFSQLPSVVIITVYHLLGSPSLLSIVLVCHVQFVLWIIVIVLMNPILLFYKVLNGA
jgi:hypothetical protein